MGAQREDVSSNMDGHPSAGLFIVQLPDANALDVAERVRAKMDELSRDFPDDLAYETYFDTTPYTRECINEVFKALRDAVLLVALVVLVFLQNWRSAVIPLVAVPVAVVGTFAVMAAMGFSLNNLTLFGLVLAIGIVVDDAIVVVEAVEHHVEHGLAPREASIKAMSQVSGPVIAVGLVLSAVFLPCALISGITGQFFRQFALAIATSTLISAFNSLTLSPALAAVLLRPREKGRYEVLPRIVYALLGGWVGYTWLFPPLAPWLAPWLAPFLRWATAGPFGVAEPETAADVARWLAAVPAAVAGATAALLLARPLNAILGRCFRLFNVGFNHVTGAYTRAVGMLLRVSALVLVVYGGLLGLTYWGLAKSPSGFIPMQDKGYLLVNVQLPDAASLERTEDVMRDIDAIARRNPGVEHTVAIAGQSILLGANAPNFGAVYVTHHSAISNP
jgi:multidrug efflux pump